MNRNILLITGYINENSVQGIRYRNLFRPCDNFRFHHLTFDSSLFSLKDATNRSIFNSYSRNLIYSFRIVRWLLLRISSSHIFPDEISFFISYYKKAILRLYLEFNIDTIVICMAPYSFLKLGPIIKNLLPEVFLIGDFSDPFSSNAKYYNSKNKIEKALMMERSYLPYFDSIIVLNRFIKEYYENMNYNCKVYVVEQGISDIFIKPKNTIKLKDKLILSYAGSFYKNFRDPKVFLKAIENSEINIELRIFGDKKISGLKSHNYKFISFLPSLNQNDLVKEYEKSHAIVLIDNFYGMQVPGKTLECLSFSRPLLVIYTNNNSPTLFYTNNIEGVYACKNNETEIVSCLKSIYSNYNHINKNFDYNPYKWEVLQKKYFSILFHCR